MVRTAGCPAVGATASSRTSRTAESNARTGAAVFIGWLLLPGESRTGSRGRVYLRAAECVPCVPTLPRGRDGDVRVEIAGTQRHIVGAGDHEETVDPAAGGADPRGKRGGSAGQLPQHDLTVFGPAAVSPPQHDAFGVAHVQQRALEGQGLGERVALPIAGAGAAGSDARGGPFSRSSGKAVETSSRPRRRTTTSSSHQPGSASSPPAAAYRPAPGCSVTVTGARSSSSFFNRSRRRTPGPAGIWSPAAVASTS